MKKFIITDDKETKALLIQEGFILLQENGSIAFFLNSNKVSFSGDKKKISYTDVMCM